jgi:membrane protein DedA with SNARE-associated domain
MAAEETGGVAGWITDVIDSIGEVGVGLLIALENIFPPLPSELILPFAGFASTRGDLNVFLAWVAATIGALVGALVLYALGALVGYDRLHALAGKRWFVVLGQKDLERGSTLFDRYQTPIVLAGRCVPLVRSVVSIPAGIARMPLPRFVLYTALGAGAWNALFIWLGRVAGDNYERIEGYVQPVSYAVLALLLLGIAALVVRTVRRKRTFAAGQA